MSTNTLARQIIFDNNKTAKSVHLSALDQDFYLHANEGVIVSAGAFRSPQLLMGSGIGPSDTLASLQIPVVEDKAGVGQNMWDHVLFGPSWSVNLITHSILGNDVEYAGLAVEQFNEIKKGILTNLGANYIGWEKLPQHLRANLHTYTRDSLDQGFPPDWPEVEFIYVDAWEGLQRDSVLGAPQDKNQYASMTVAIITPFSRGNVSISSADTGVHPIVNPNWLSDSRDMDLAVQMYRRAREFFAAPSIKPILLGDEAFPGSNYTTDHDLEDLIRRGASTVHHACCTCKLDARVKSVHFQRVMLIIVSQVLWV